MNRASASRTPTARSPSLSVRLWAAAFVLAVVALLGVGLEIADRYLRTGSLHMVPTWFVPDQDLLYAFNPAKLPGSLRTGPPGPKVPGRVRVLCLGGSTTFGFAVAAQDSWPAIMQTLLRDRGVPADVINAGVIGYGSRQLLRWYRRDLAALDADWIVVFEGWNRTGALVDPGEYAPLGLKPSDGWLARLSLSIGRRSLLLRDAIAAGYKLPLLFSDSYEIDRFQDEFVADMTMLVREIQAHGQRPVLILYPALYHDGMTGDPTVLYGRALFSGLSYRPEMLEELHRKHAALRAIGRETDTPLIDVNAAFQDVRGAERAALFLDEGHLSSSGNRRVAETIAGELAEMIVGQPPADAR